VKPRPPADLDELVCDPAPLEPVPQSLVEHVLRAVESPPPSSTGENPGQTAARKKPDLGHTTALPPGSLLGAYRILRKIGDGGMGVVYAAEDLKLRRHVAIKAMNQRLANDPVAKERFEREARSVAAIQHDNVVTVYHVGGEGEVLYLVMPLLRGESLSARLDRGALLPDEVVSLARQALSGLEVAHAKGLIHRDIKPANLWLEAPGDRVKILDFGLARLASGDGQVTSDGAVVGTPEYMSPEQAEGSGLDHRTDLFSLGAVLYHAVTGGKPFRGKSIAAVTRAVQTHAPPPPCEVDCSIPKPLSDFIMRLLEKKPGNRPRDATAGLAALDEKIPGTRPRASPATTSAWLPQARRRSRRPVALIGLVLAVCCAIPLTVNSWRSSVAEPVEYQGRVDVLVRRNSEWTPAVAAGALPLRADDVYKVTVDIKPAGYVYAFLIETDGKGSPIYPWIPSVGWGSRPEKEKPVSGLTLPEGNDFGPERGKLLGVVTVVVFASPTPLSLTDSEFQAWFHNLPPIQPEKGTPRVVWFENYAPPRANSSRAQLVASNDPYERWQMELKKRVGERVHFETSLSFIQSD
jgi:serine/threonine protein kinase